MRAVLLVTLLVGCGRVGFDEGGVALDSTGNGAVSANAVTALQLTTLDVGAGPDACLIAALALTNQNATDVTLRWNDTPLTPVTSELVANTSGVVFVHRLIGPEAGQQILSAEWTGESDAVLGALSVSGADQAECVRPIATGRGNSDTASVTIPSAPGHLTIDVSATASTFDAPTQRSSWSALADGTPAVRQQADHIIATATTDTCTLPASATPGHTLVFVGATVASSLSSVTGAGVAWQLAAKSTENANIEIWYGTATADPGTSITYAGTVATAMRCWVGELTGLTTSADPLDVASFADGLSGPASTGPLVTTNARDLLIAGYSSHLRPTWGEPSEGPWTSLGEVVDDVYSQIAFAQAVTGTGTWNPAIPLSSTDPRWDAVAAAFTISSPGVGAALSTARGTASNTHAWSLGTANAWLSIGLEVFP